MLLISQHLCGQEGYTKKIEALKERKQKITVQEKDALKVEIEDINKRLKNNEITKVEAQQLKEAAAKKRALNIENRIAIVDNEIALLERNNGRTLALVENDSLDDDKWWWGIDFNGKPKVFFKRNGWERRIRYDRRTYSEFVIAVGLNNAIIEGEPLDDSPYSIGGSRFFEFGWEWRTRVFKHTNFMRFHYGFSFQFNGLVPADNQIFVIEGDQTVLQDFEFDLRKSKLRVDNLVFPFHLEFGPSRVRETEHSIRYSIRDQFRFGIGGYGGFNLGTRQKLKFSRDGERVKQKEKRSFNTTDLIYGLSAYIGVDGILLYARYDLNPLFRNAIVEQRNIALGLRFDL